LVNISSSTITHRWSVTITPTNFAELKRIALDLGFFHVESGPLVRSSLPRRETADAYASATRRRRKNTQFGQLVIWS